MGVVTQDFTASLRRAIRVLTETSTLVGVPSDAEQPHLGANPGPNVRVEGGKPHITNAALAYIHTHGAPEINLPARPFLMPGLQDKKDEIVERLQYGATAALKGDYGTVDRVFDQIGLIGQSAARRKIAEGIPPPLRPATVAARRRRSKGSSYRRKASAQAQEALNASFDAGIVSMAESPTTPLIDTGSLLASITYVKRRK